VLCGVLHWFWFHLVDYPTVGLHVCSLSANADACMFVRHVAEGSYNLAAQLLPKRNHK
jgi:hypothetical protein